MQLIERLYTHKIKCIDLQSIIINGIKLSLDSDMQLLKEVPLYNDVMLPSSSKKLPLSLSPLTPTESTPALSKLETEAEEFPYRVTTNSTNTPSTSGLGSPGVRTVA